MSAITDKTLLENFLNLIPAGVFWKDKDSRFLGANQMILDYYPKSRTIVTQNFVLLTYTVNAGRFHTLPNTPQPITIVLNLSPFVFNRIPFDKASVICFAKSSTFTISFIMSAPLYYTDTCYPLFLISCKMIKSHTRLCYRMLWRATACPTAFHGQ